MFGFGAVLLQGVIESEFTQYSQVVTDLPCLGVFFAAQIFLDSSGIVTHVYSAEGRGLRYGR